MTTHMNNASIKINAKKIQNAHLKCLQLLTTSVVVTTLLTTCGTPQPSTSTPKFDSASSTALDATITDATMLTSSPTYNVDSQIKDQLYFSIGMLNNWGSVADLANRTVTIKSIAAVPGSPSLSIITYDAKFKIAWSRNRQIPSSIIVPVPARGDYEGIHSFYSKYEGTCVQDRHELSYSNFWYYIRPLMAGCPLASRSGNEEFTYLLKVNTSVSNTNTSGKFPEYSKVWEDQQLVATNIFGKYVSGAGDSDLGVAEFNSMYRHVLRNFGTPISSNVNLQVGEVPGTENPDVRLVFKTRRGKVDINLLLVNSMGYNSSEWRTHFNERTLISDFVSYNGHSGLGANIRSIATMGKFKANQFQLYYLNGCDTYSYLGTELADAHHTVNPDSQASRFLDVITNSMPSPFTSMASSTNTILMSLYNKQYTYRQILSMINSGQNPNVRGEEDNKWPQPF
jgi:hypothetical protein